MEIRTGCIGPVCPHLWPKLLQVPALALLEPGDLAGIPSAHSQHYLRSLAGLLLTEQGYLLMLAAKLRLAQGRQEALDCTSPHLAAQAPTQAQWVAQHCLRAWHGSLSSQLASLPPPPATGQAFPLSPPPALLCSKPYPSWDVFS